MKMILSLIAVFISVNVFAQTTRRVKDDEDKNIREIYYVLKSDKNIKEGPYLKKQLHFGSKICDGFYKNNLKDSLWKYYRNNDKIYRTGHYKEDKKVGVWEVYNSAGYLEIQYDYTQNRLLFFKLFTPDEKWDVINGKDTINTFLDRVPINLNGGNEFLQIFSSNIHFPSAAKKAHLIGRVTIAYTIDTLGNTVNYRVKEGAGYGCDEEVMRVVKLFDTEWLPGMLKGKPVATECSFTTTFNFEPE